MAFVWGLLRYPTLAAEPEPGGELLVRNVPALPRQGRRRRNRPSGFDDSYLVGRTLTALFDTGTVLLVFAIGSLLWSRRVGLLAALLSALTVLQIQLAHFWTVDPYLTFFSAATLYLSIRIARSGGVASCLLCGAAIGLGLASKVTALTLVALPVAAVALRVVTSARGNRTAARISSQLGRGILALAGCGAAAFAVFRVAQPYAFTGPHFWDIGLDGRFLDVLREQRVLTSGNAGYPPFVQWAHRPGYVFPLENILFWGLGVPLGLAALRASSMRPTASSVSGIPGRSCLSCSRSPFSPPTADVSWPSLAISSLPTRHSFCWPQSCSSERGR